MVKFCQGRVSKVLYSSSFFSLYISGLAESENWGQKRRRKKENTKEGKKFLVGAWCVHSWKNDVEPYGSCHCGRNWQNLSRNYDADFYHQRLRLSKCKAGPKRSASTEIIFKVNKKIANNLKSVEELRVCLLIISDSILSLTLITRLS